MSIRTKAIVSMMLLVMLICASFLTLIYRQSQHSLLHLVDDKREVAALLADSILTQTQRSYQQRLKALVSAEVSATRREMIQAFAERDRETLLRLSRPPFEVLKKENPYFFSLGWILPDNHVFLRVQDPDQYGDDITQRRPDIVAVNQTRQPNSGFNGGKSLPQYRVNQPVFYEGEYVGVVQVGVDACFILNQLEEKLGLPFVFQLESRNPAILAEEREEGFVPLVETPGNGLYSTDNELFAKLADKLDCNAEKQQIQIQKNPYILHRVVPLQNFKGEHLTCIFTLANIADMTQDANHTISVALLLGALLLIVTYFILHFSFGALVGKIFRLNSSLEKSNIELEQRVNERTRELRREMDERKAVEDKLHRAEKMEAIGMMASGVAHDLNNILSGIISYPELLLMRVPEDSKLRRPLGEIKEAGLRAAAVVADLLTVARDSAKVRSRENLNRLVLTYLHLPEAELLRKNYPGVRIQTELAAELPDIECSPTHVNKCIMNLVLNAAEAIGEAGEVLIKTGGVPIDGSGGAEPSLPAGDYVMLSIADSGPGISADDMKQIFEPFYTKKKLGRSGTGIGLTVVWNCMQEHGGQVSVASDGEHGTCFTLYFPLAGDGQSLEVDPVKVDGTLGHGEKILIVDDEARQRTIASEILTELGYSVAAVTSGEEAIAWLRKQDAALLILDMLMEPGINGLETYTAIVRFKPQQKALIVSGYSDAENVNQTLALGAEEFLSKPYTLEQIGAAVGRILGGPDQGKHDI